MTHEHGEDLAQARREVRQLRRSVRWARHVIEHPEEAATEYHLDHRELQELFELVHSELVRSYFAISRTLIGHRWAVDVDERSVVVQGVLPPVLRSTDQSILYMRGPIPPITDDDDDEDDAGDRQDERDSPKQ